MKIYETEKDKFGKACTHVPQPAGHGETVCQRRGNNGTGVYEDCRENFDPKNPWDQAVMIAILTNMLAYVEVNAELDGANMERAMKDLYETNLEDYRQQAFKGKKVKR